MKIKNYAEILKSFKAKVSPGEEKLARDFMAIKLSPERQYKFHPDRKWQVDFAFPNKKLIAEVEGGTYSSGRHTRGSGFAKDCEKYNEATLLGWRVFRFTTEQVDSGYAINTIQKAMTV